MLHNIPPNSNTPHNKSKTNGRFQLSLRHVLLAFHCDPLTRVALEQPCTQRMSSLGFALE